MRGIIYLYRDETGKPVYVGQTIQPLKVRHKQHLTKSKNNLFNNKLQNHEYSLEIVCEAESDQLDALEQHYIEVYHTLYPNGLNLTIGGTNNCKHVRGVISDYAKKKSRPVKALSPDTLDWITFDSIAEASRVTGVSRNDIRRCLMGKQLNAGGYKWASPSDTRTVTQILEDTKYIHSSSMRVKQKDIANNTINIYYSICEASRQTKITQPSISECIKGARHTAGGYIWELC